MITQKFEEIPEPNSLEMMVDLLRYENASQANVIADLEKQISKLEMKLTEAGEDLDKLQHVLDLQNARTFRDLSS